ncbi:MAG: toxin-activating lysine-acyltransferase, partial [Magnetospirillum sp.]
MAGRLKLSPSVKGRCSQAIMPALMLRQFRLWRTDTQPIAFASWACADDAVAARLEAGKRTLTAAEWQSGERKVTVDLIRPLWWPGGVRAGAAGGVGMIQVMEGWCPMPGRGRWRGAIPSTTSRSR